MATNKKDAPEEVQAPANGELSIDINDVVAKMKSLYPTQFAHVLSECKVDVLSKALAGSES